MRFLYFDNNATTPTDPKVFEAMRPYFEDMYANAASTHKFGKQIKTSIQKARNYVAGLLNALPEEIIFTSGATESVNLALKGIAQSYTKKGHHIITLATEHKAVLDTCTYLESIGFEVTYLPLLTNGLLDLELLRKHLRTDTVLVSCMLVNNETGVIQPIQQIAQLSHEAGAFFFTDATQAFGKLPIDVDECHIDLLAFSGHKIYGPKGVGGLYVRNGIRLESILHGGGHENSFRSGTLNTPGIVGLGMAAHLAAVQMQEDQNRIQQLRDQLEQDILAIEGTAVNGSTTQRLYNITNISFEGIQSDVLIGALDNICVSSGSACTSSIPEPSYVLKAMGIPNEKAFGSIRFSLGRFNTTEEVSELVQQIKQRIAELRCHA